MKEKLLSLIPEIAQIQDDHLKEAVIKTYIQALTVGGWEADDMAKLPFTLIINNCPASYLAHTRAVIRMCMDVRREYNEIYQSEGGYALDHDRLLAGAILHDVGKLVEYQKSQDGTFVKSGNGKNLRHPFSGTALAVNNGVPYEIAHIIANHAKEGDGTLRSPEAVVVNKVDVLNFESIKAHLGMI